MVPVWGVLVDDDLYLETGAANTKKVRNLAANPAVAVHLVGPPWRQPSTPSTQAALRALPIGMTAASTESNRG